MVSPQGIVFKDLGENPQTQRDKWFEMVDKLNCENNPLIQKDQLYYTMTISLVPLTTACHGKRVEQDTSRFHIRILEELSSHFLLPYN